MITLSATETWYSLYATIKTTLELGQGTTKTNAVFLKGSIASDFEIYEGLSRMAVTLQKNPDFLKPFDNLPGTVKGTSLRSLLESYSQDSFQKNIKNISEKEIKLANGMQNKLDTIYAQAANENKGEEITDKNKEVEKDEKPLENKEIPSEKIEIKTKGGTSIVLGGKDKKEEDGDDTRDKGKPTLYGEEIDPISGKYAISIHSIECVEDEYAWDDLVYTIESKQEFKDFPVPIIINFTSKVHEDIDSGEVLSAIDSLRNPRNEGYTKLSIFDEDRCCLRYNREANVNGVITKYEEKNKGFNLDKFERCIIDVSLIDASSSFSEYLSKIVQFIGKIGSLGFDVLQVSTIDQIVNNLIGKPSKSGLKELIEWLEELLKASKTSLGSDKFVVMHDAFKSRIESGTLTSSRYGFSWIKGPTIEMDGNGAKYKVSLRYEKLD